MTEGVSEGASKVKLFLAELTSSEASSISEIFPLSFRSVEARDWRLSLKGLSLVCSGETVFCLAGTAEGFGSAICGTAAATIFGLQTVSLDRSRASFRLGEAFLSLSLSLSLREASLCLLIRKDSSYLRLLYESLFGGSLFDHCASSHTDGQSGF